MVTTPSLIRVMPLCVLVPVKVTRPEPSFSTDPLPDMLPEYVPSTSCQNTTWPLLTMLPLRLSVVPCRVPPETVRPTPSATAPLRISRPGPALVRLPLDTSPANSTHFVTGLLTEIVRVAPPRSTSPPKVSEPVRVVSSPSATLPCSTTGRDTS